MRVFSALFGNNESAVDIRARAKHVQWAVAAPGNENANRLADTRTFFSIT